ncbi:DDE Tnp4 domain-containing protein [Aphis craccivora]|uniref:DDE Tnp4 domain-containing protein n=1 Tax=Aphis craccivora TaxID=307492 RepID=A0A6G0VHY3_APHCR|nr:DDE Tnp4 domain-containing protein [Aphis craccivora]
MDFLYAVEAIVVAYVHMYKRNSVEFKRRYWISLVRPCLSIQITHLRFPISTEERLTITLFKY